MSQICNCPMECGLPIGVVDFVGPHDDGKTVYVLWYIPKSCPDVDVNEPTIVINEIPRDVFESDNSKELRDRLYRKNIGGTIKANEILRADEICTNFILHRVTFPTICSNCSNRSDYPGSQFMPGTWCKNFEMGECEKKTIKYVGASGAC
jgi:hypothetical protein